jgi:hypothetical protein
MSQGADFWPRLERLRRLAFAVGGLGLAASGFAWFSDRTEFTRMWLIAFLYWIALPLGSLALTMLHNLTGGGWGLAIQRWMQAAMRTLPLFVLLFLPIALGIHELYEWSHEDVVAADPLLAHKAPYLNSSGFLIRTALYFALWIGLATWLGAGAKRLDAGGGEAVAARMRYISGPGLALYFLAMTFAAIDWAMSLEPHWFSTIYGVVFIIGQALATLAFTILLSAWASQSAPLKGRLLPTHLHDLGKLLFAFVLLWAYVNYSQFVIIWSANLAEETPWYIKREQGAWLVIAVVLIALHFALPFLVLLSKTVKHKPKVLGGLAAGLLLMRLVDIVWYVAPSFSHDIHNPGFHLHWSLASNFLGIGGLWLGVFLSQLRNRPLTSLPEPDPHALAAAHH